MGERIIRRNAAAGCRGDDVEFAETEKFNELMQVLRGDAGLGAIDWRRTVIAAPGIGDDAIACLGEDRLLVAPDQAAARRRMEEHYGLAGSACVPEPQPRIGKLRDSFLGRRLRRYWDWGERIDHRLGGGDASASYASGAECDRDACSDHCATIDGETHPIRHLGHGPLPRTYIGFRGHVPWSSDTRMTISV